MNIFYSCDIIPTVIVMSQTNSIIFKGLRVAAWFIFVGLCVEAGALIVNFFFSLYNPEFVSKLYQKLDLSELYGQSKWVFFCMYSYITCIAVFKAVLFYVIIKLVTEINLIKPFNVVVPKQIFKISYYTLSIGLLSYLARQTVQNLGHRGYSLDMLNEFWVDSSVFILMAGIVYVIGIIFARGVEIQNEKELTV